MSWTEESKRATRVVLGAFRGMPGMDTGDRQTDIHDLIVNLLHVLREDGHETEPVVWAALDTFRDEASAILADADKELAKLRLEQQVDAAKAVVSMLLQRWQEAEQAGLVPDLDNYGKELASLDELAAGLAGVELRFLDNDPDWWQRERERQRQRNEKYAPTDETETADKKDELTPEPADVKTPYTADFKVKFYADDIEQASEFVQSVGDSLIQTERVTTVQGHCDDASAALGWMDVS